MANSHEWTQLKASICLVEWYNACSFVGFRGQRPTASLEDRAGAKVLELLDSLDGVHCVVWMDNFYRRTVSSHPLRRQTGGMNTTVFAVLHTISLPPFTAFVGLHRWEEGGRVAARLVDKFSAKLDRLLDMVKATEWSDDNIRVPLDIHREGRPLQWKPLALTSDVIGSQVGLLNCFHLLQTIASTTTSPTPLLVDVNIHYRLQKMLFNPAYSKWDVAARLSRTPPVFAIWHVYKHCCVLVRRCFFSIFAFVERGAVTTALSGSAHLRNTELLVAAMMMLPMALKEELRRHVGQCADELKKLLPGVPEGDRAARKAFCVGVCDDVEDVRAEVVRCFCRLVVAEAVVDLVDYFAPCCFLLGWMTRKCHWEGRERRTGEFAWEHLALSLYVMRSCGGDGARHMEYYRSVVLAMASWTDWYQELPACCFSEEVCEAGLSRLSRSLGDHSHRSTVEDAMNLYLLVDPARPGKRHVGGQAVTERFLNEVVVRIRQVLDLPNLPLAYLPWRSGGMVAVEDWGFDVEFPMVCRKMDRSMLMADTLYAQRTLLSRTALSQDVEAAMDAHFDLVEDSRAHVRTNEAEVWLEDHPVRPVRVPRRSLGERVRPIRRVVRAHPIFEVLEPGHRGDEECGVELSVAAPVYEEPSQSSAGTRLVGVEEF
jgi:hypothetical protein